MPGSGWDLDDTGTMAGPDNVGWSKPEIDARPFVANASNPTPPDTLLQELSARQNFVAMNFPARTWNPATVASTTHRRAIEDRANGLKAVTSANNAEIVDDYAGPTVFRRCRASPATVPASVPGPDAGPPQAPSRTTVQVDAEGASATPRFSIQGSALGCTINPSSGELTVGSTPGLVTVRGGNATNFDATAVTITPRPAKP